MCKDEAIIKGGCGSVGLGIVTTTINCTSVHWRLAIEDHRKYKETQCHQVPILQTKPFEQCSYSVSDYNCTKPCFVVRVDYLTSHGTRKTSTLFKKSDLDAYSTIWSGVSRRIWISIENTFIVISETGLDQVPHRMCFIGPPIVLC